MTDKYRIITDGKRFRAQYTNSFGEWTDFELERRFEERVGKAYHWKWLAEFRIWQDKRRVKRRDEHARRRRIDQNAIWEKL